MERLTLVLLLLPTSALAQSALDVHVLDDKGKGVQSDVVMLGQPQGRTDSGGRMKIASSCAQAVQIQAKPVDPYYSAGAITCTPSDKSVSIKVTADETYANLKMNLEYFQAKSDFAAVALTKTEIAARTVDPGEAVMHRTAAYKAMGEYFNIPANDAVTPYMNGKAVGPSPELVAAIHTFQSRNKLPRTGKLDYLTLQRASSKTANEILFATPAAER